MVKPITPAEAKKIKNTTFPKEVIEGFNEAIAKHLRGNSARFTQDEVVELIMNKGINASRAQLFDNGWMDVEDTYRELGWKVVYDKPGYCETYPATFTFSIK